MDVEGARSRELSTLDRVVVASAGLILALLGAAIALSGLGYRGAGSLRSVLELLGGGLVEGLLGGLFLLAIGLYLVFLGLRQEEDDGIRQETEMGHVRISLRAIENLVRRLASGVKGVREVDVAVHPSPEGVAVSLFLVVHPDVSIPVISEEVGRRVRAQVRETVGVDVGDVSVSIRNIVAEGRPRVE